MRPIGRGSVRDGDSCAGPVRMQASRSKVGLHRLLPYAGPILSMVPRDGEGSRSVGQLASPDQAIQRDVAKCLRRSFRADFNQR